jgi:hypothetical protein
MTGIEITTPNWKFAKLSAATQAALLKCDPNGHCDQSMQVKPVSHFEHSQNGARCRIAGRRERRLCAIALGPKPNAD